MRVVTQIISNSGFYNVWEDTVSFTITSCLFLSSLRVELGSLLTQKGSPKCYLDALGIVSRGASFDLSPVLFVVAIVLCNDAPSDTY